MTRFISLLSVLSLMLITVSCSTTGGAKKATAEVARPPLVFHEDTAYAYCAAQCAFGPRTMNSTAHDNCAAWIKTTFSQHGMTVASQKATLTAYNGTPLAAENIIAQYKPTVTPRILLAAHYDSRPWADNDPDESKHHTPIIAANDGASGIAVLLALAQMLATDSIGVGIGVDFLCFDAEDYGTPQWDDNDYGEDYNSSDTWALGAKYWAENFVGDSNNYLFGILLDMVGGEGATFYQEQFSQHYAPDIVSKVWRIAKKAGYSAFFNSSPGAYITDDHIPVNTIAHIKCIDIIPYIPDCEQSSFGPTWHTTQDNLDHISTATLKAVGQTIATLLQQY